MARSLSFWESELSRVETLVNNSRTEAERRSWARELNQIQNEINNFKAPVPNHPTRTVVNDPDVKVEKAPEYTTVTSTTTTTTTTDKKASIPENTSNLESELKKWYNEVLEAPGEIVDKIGDIFPEITKDVLTGAKDIGQVPVVLVEPTVEQVPASLGTGVEGLAGGVGGGIEELLGSFTQAVQVGFSQIGMGLQTGLTSLGAGIGGGVGNVGQGVGSGVSGLGSGVGDTLKEIAPYAIIGLIGYAIVKKL